MVYPLPKPVAKRDVIFNIYGSSVVAFVSVILLMMVSRFAGQDAAGIFSLCYSTGQMLYTVAAFELRTIQVTENREKFTFGDMLAFRILTAAFMLAFSVVFLLVKGFAGVKFTVALLIVLYMALLSFSDVFGGNMHLNGYLSIAGFSNGTGVLLAAAAFVIALIFTENLIISVIPMIAVMALWVLLFDMPFSRNFDAPKPRFCYENLKSLFFATVPLVISVFMNQYNLNSPKYAIDKFLTDADQSRYGYLVMPAFVINLMSIFVFRPQIISLSKKWKSRDFGGFTRLVVILFGWIAFCTVAVLVGAYFLGIPILNILYSTRLVGMRGYLLLLISGGAFAAGSSLTLVLLSVMRKQKLCLIAYGAAFILALFVPNLLVRHFGFFGAVLSYISVTLSLFVGLILIFVISYIKEKKRGC